MKRPATQVPGNGTRPGWFTAPILVALALAACEAHDPEACAADERLIDGSCQSQPPACGEPAPECGDCDAPGAIWRCSYFRPDVCWCECPSGDAGCPCWDESHCQGVCLNLINDGRCDEKTEGVCSERVVMKYSCQCEVQDGVGVPNCYD